MSRRRAGATFPNRWRDRGPRMRKAVRRTLLVLTALAVIGGMLISADRAQRQADRARQAQVVMQQIRGSGERLGAVTWESLVRLTGAPPPRVVAEGLRVYRAFAASLRELRRLGVDGTRITQIERLLERTYTVGLRTTMTARQGDVPGSRRMAIGSLAPTIDRLNATVAAAARDQGAIARRAQSHSRLAVAGSLAVGLIALALLMWRMHRLGAAARAAHRRNENRLGALMRHSSDAVLIVSARGNVLWVSESARQVLGRAPADTAGRSLASLVRPQDAARVNALIAAACAGDGTARARLRRVERAGEQHLEAIADDRRDDPDVAGVLLNLRDVSERVELERELRHRAFHDTLTELPNRALFEKHLDRALVRRLRGVRPAAVVFLDLDGFKEVNDTLGHHAGDDLLRAVAKRLGDVLRQHDTPARLGGDEFAVLLEDLVDEDDGCAIAERIRAAIGEPLALSGHVIIPAASVGIAFAERGMSAEELLGHADAAMYRAKHAADDRVVRFEPLRAVAAEPAAGRAPDPAAEGPRIEYQPVIALADGRIAGFEALVADTPAAGSPGPLAPQVIREAARQRSRWADELPELAALDLYVHLPPAELMGPDLLGAVHDALAEPAPPGSRLLLEITEPVALDRLGDMHARLEALVVLGSGLVAGHAPSGGAAITPLAGVPLAARRIDVAALGDLVAHANADSPATDPLARLRNGGVAVVVTGTDRDGDAALAARAGATHAQGLFVSRPLSPEDCAELLAARGQPRSDARELAR